MRMSEETYTVKPLRILNLWYESTHTKTLAAAKRAAKQEVLKTHTAHSISRRYWDGSEEYIIARPVPTKSGRLTVKFTTES